VRLKRKRLGIWPLKRANYAESAPGDEERRLKQSGAANFWWVWEALASQRGRPPSLRRGPLSGPTLGRLIRRDALNVSRALAPSGGLVAEPPSRKQGASRYRPARLKRKRLGIWPLKRANYAESAVFAAMRRKCAPGDEERRLKQSGAANFWWVWEALASQRGRSLSLRRGLLSGPTPGRLIMAGRAQCFARTRTQRGLGGGAPSGKQTRTAIGPCA
jgi:hypothetical protein